MRVGYLGDILINLYYYLRFGRRGELIYQIILRQSKIKSGAGRRNLGLKNQERINPDPENLELKDQRLRETKELNPDQRMNRV